MIYLDTSCLVKLLLDEPESEAVRAAVSAETTVVISALAELEVEIQLRGEVDGGRLRRTQWRHHQARLVAMRNLDPFLFRAVPASVFSTALRQTRHPDSLYCRTLDRLHLAAAEVLEIERIMTLDQTQAKVAASLGLKVLAPGRS
jgi:predicted nucleic acid-binding protein